ncbi:hypothetical protein G6011_05308 [Alternaria panax]|uniref:RING-type domain-containing protein n=1 Tax=Alternaria panax TaxID=48097 RepID=A0AAD4I6N0_9PLEO|nr:hypothetical protein G6011_05308 [Alternaria panax]
MTVFANKETFNSLGLEQFQQSHAHASQDCAICLRPLAVHPTKDDIPDPKCHVTVRIAACGHIVGKDCLDAWLDVGHTCPVCACLLFEPTGDPITQGDINYILHILGPELGEHVIMVVVARLMARQEQEHEIELERAKARETQVRNDGFALSDEDFLDSDDDMNFDDVDDNEEFEAGENNDDDFEVEEDDKDSI